MNGAENVLFKLRCKRRRLGEKGSSSSPSFLSKRALVDGRDLNRSVQSGRYGIALRTSSEKVGNGLARMTVEIEPAELQSEYARAVKRISGKARIPGFRPGKAPRSVVESMFGKPAIIGEALEHLVPDAYERAIREESLEPIDRPELDLSEVEEIDQPVVFTATVPLRPTVELGDVESISLTKDRVTVEDHELDEVLNDIRRSRAELKQVDDRRLQEGDVGEARLSIISGEIEKSRRQARVVHGRAKLAAAGLRFESDGDGDRRRSGIQPRHPRRLSRGRPTRQVRDFHGGAAFDPGARASRVDRRARRGGLRFQDRR